MLQSAKDAMAVVPIWTIIVVTSVLMLVGCARAGSIVLWNVTEPPSGRRLTARAPANGWPWRRSAPAACS